MHSVKFNKGDGYWLTRGWRFTCQVNTYPTDRGFTAIGTGGDDFVHAMVVAVESVIEREIPEVTCFALKKPLNLFRLYIITRDLLYQCSCLSI